MQRIDGMLFPYPYNRPPSVKHEVTTTGTNTEPTREAEVFSNRHIAEGYLIIEDSEADRRRTDLLNEVITERVKRQTVRSASRSPSGKMIIKSSMSPYVAYPEDDMTELPLDRMNTLSTDNSPPSNTTRWSYNNRPPKQAGLFSYLSSELQSESPPQLAHRSSSKGLHGKHRYVIIVLFVKLYLEKKKKKKSELIKINSRKEYLQFMSTPRTVRKPHSADNSHLCWKYVSSGLV